MSSVADLVVHHADVWTMDPARPRARAVAVRAGRVVAVGDDAEIAAYRARATRVIDAGGRFVMPGFYDSHNHLMKTGLSMLRPGLGAAASIADVQAVVAAAAAGTEPGGWIETGASWHENQLSERRLPAAAELDAAAPGHPVVVARGGHNLVASSEALRRAGITADTPSPPGGTYVRDEAGRLTGHVIGKPALAPILAALPRVDDAQLATAVTAAARAYAASGITSVIEPGLSLDQMAVYRDIAARGELTVRTSMMWLPPIGSTADAAVEAIEDGGFTVDLDGEWCRTTGIKLLADGGVETGFYREPYLRPDDPAHPCGKALIEPDVLTAVCRAVARRGWQLGVHVLGDAATDAVLDAFAAAERDTRAGLPRWTLIHLLNPRAEHWRRIHDLRLAITVQPALFWQLAGGFVDYLGHDRAADIGPLADLVRRFPTTVGGGSDSPVAPFAPLPGMASAATRGTRDAGVLGPRWAVDIPTMLRLYTTGSAWCGREEHTKGCLAPGRFGDLVVLSEDPREVPPGDVSQIEVLTTVVGGRVVHDALDRP